MNPHPLLLALQDRRRSWPSLLALPALVGLLAVGLTVAAKLPPARVAAALTAAGVFALWGLLSHSLILQNRASLAQLVPGHTRALRRLLLAGSLASCLLIVLLLRGAGLRLSGLELALMASALMAAVGWMQAVPLPGPLLGFAWAIGLSQGIDGLRQHGPLLSDTVSGLGPLAWGAGAGAAGLAALGLERGWSHPCGASAAARRHQGHAAAPATRRGLAGAHAAPRPCRPACRPGSGAACKPRGRCAAWPGCCCARSPRRRCCCKAPQCC
jgi:hypothetical protein